MVLGALVRYLVDLSVSALMVEGGSLFAGPVVNVHAPMIIYSGHIHKTECSTKFI